MNATANAKPALLLIDIQQAMFGPEEICDAPEKILANTGALLARARADSTPIFHVQHCEAEGMPLAHRSAGWQIHPSVAAGPGEPIIEKWACSAFYNTDLDQRLRAAGIDRLVIAGLQTEFCIDTACRVAQSLGYKVTLASDAHSSFDNSALSAEKIIAHHNRVLSGIIDSVTPAGEIRF